MNKKDAVRTKSFENLPEERRTQVKFVADNYGRVKKYLDLCDKGQWDNTRESLEKWLAAAGIPTDEKRLKGLVQQCDEFSSKAKKTAVVRHCPKRRHSISSEVEEDDSDEFGDALNFALENGLSSRQAETYAKARTDDRVLELLRGN
ncbi:hypothetical protein IKT64_03310 [Candidatus Saccharibacteria bacterium]|nr:hypothetical protein [Candidatus Saccharibacteria bacterium]